MARCLRDLKIGDMYDENYVVTEVDDAAGTISISPKGPKHTVRRVIFWTLFALIQLAGTAWWLWGPNS
ncbi:hypothetical protein LCGC14_0651640 [marine sediment metagenome]|uniref:Uncharacterized protein n=1 Tax=marine sediment metagenome TaxID=412755 RepID=A0A0F9RFZ7_9ZZZZ